MSDDLLRAPTEAASALPAGTRLGEFELLSLLGVGGFGIVYLAFDHQLEREVAVKEYMPASMAGRTETMHVSLRSQSDAEIFALGLRSFVNEAKLLARFDHPSLLKVHRFWEANGTAYMAMPVLRGRTLKDVRQGRQSLESPINEAWLRAMLEPLLGALDRLHSAGVYHRDIAPDNIQIEPGGHPVLLDFGAARRVISDKTQTLTAILKPAYAPIEQYAEAGSVKQGPWTDLYALGATIHYMLLSHPPAPATARAVNDDQAPLSSQTIEGCSEDFLHIVDWMLAPRPGDRPQSVAALREVLSGHTAPPQRRPAESVSPSQWERTQVVPPSAPKAAPVPSVDDEATRVMAPPRPPAAGSRVVASASASAPASAASAAAVPAAAARVAPAQPVLMPASRGAPPVASVAAASPGSASAGGSRLLVPVLAGVVVLAAAAAGAFAFWPRSAGAPEAAAGAAPAATTLAAPAAGLAPATVPVTQGTAATAAAAGASPSAAEPAPATSTGPAVDPGTRARAESASPTPATVANPPAAAAPPPRAADPTPQRAAVPRPATAVAPPPVSTQAPLPPPARYEPVPAPTPPPPVAPKPAPPPPAAPTQAPAAPAPVEPLKAVSPEARCGGRNPLSYFACMERECYRSEFMSHPDCLKWRKDARPRETTGN